MPLTRITLPLLLQQREPRRRGNTASGAQGRDDDDTVSICSDDIDPDDDFAWYSNSREFIVIDTIPDPIFGDIRSDYIEMPEDSVTGPLPPQYPLSNSTNSIKGSTTAPSTIPTFTRAHFYQGGPNYPFGLQEPKHGIHRQCNITRFVSTISPNLPLYFPDVQSLYLVDYDLTLRPDITELPTQGRRWLTGSPDTLFVEVVDPADGTWVSDDEVRPAWEAKQDFRKRQQHGTPDQPSVAEYVTWLRQYSARFLPRKVEVGLVAYLVMDGEGKVSFERRPKRQIWKPYC